MSALGSFSFIYLYVNGLCADILNVPLVCGSCFPRIDLRTALIFHNAGVRLDRVRGGRQKYKRRPEVENATYQSAPLPLTKESEKGGIYILALS